MLRKRIPYLMRAMALGGAAALILTACGGSNTSSDDSSSKPHTGGVIKAAVNNEVRSLDPVDLSIYFTSGGDRAIAIYGTLMKYGKDGETVPAMAKTFTSDDGKVWTLKLRDGVKFTDGTAYDAEAVKFNLDRQMAPDSTSTGKPLLDAVADMKVLDPLTLQFTLSKANGSFSSLFTQGSNLGFIGSPKAIKADPKGFGTKPVGAGPYVLEEFARDDHLTVVRNKKYWDKPRPYVDKIIYNIVPDEQTRLQSLLSGQLNMGGTFSSRSWGQVKGNAEYTIYKDGPPGASVLFPNVQRGPAADPRVRKAMQLAFDPKASNKILNPGMSDWNGNRDCLPFPEGSPQCTDNVPKYDLAAAKKLISDYKADGNSVHMGMLTTTSLAAEGKYFQQVLESIGLDIKLDIAEVAVYSAAVPKGNYDSVASMFLPFPNPYPKVFNFFDPNGSNYAKQKDSKMDAALVKSRDGNTKAERDAAWKDVLTRVNDQGFAVWVAPAPRYIVTTSKVHLGNKWVAGGSIWYPADAWVD